MEKLNRSHWQAALVGLLGAAAVAALTMTVVRELSPDSARAHVTRVERSVAVDGALRAFEAAFVGHDRTQASLDLGPGLSLDDPRLQEAYESWLSLQRSSAELTAAVDAADLEATAAPLSSAVEDYFEAGTALASLFESDDVLPEGEVADASPTAEALVAERSDALLVALDGFHAHLDQMQLDAVRELESGQDQARRIAGAVGWTSAVVLLLLAVVAMRRLGRDERRQATTDRRHRAESDRNEFEMRVRGGLEMSSGEDDAFRVLHRSLGGLPQTARVELLVSDSSRTHFQRPVARAGDVEDGCSVASPADCPAARRGHRLVFPSSDAVDACPHLPAGDQACAAVCVPLSMAGATAGVLHAVTPVGAPLGGDEIATLETIARAAGDRIGMLRAFARSETQAAVDPLTGLLNRRSFENRARPLFEAHRPFTVCFADLDHFKLLNDKHGHDTGDRALRLFGKILAEETRPADLVARYGGEEFVILLPDCGLADVSSVLGRIRNRLASDTGTGGLPAVTVSVGIAQWDEVADLSEMVARADRALLEAKDAGRNRDRVFQPMAVGPVPPVEAADVVVESAPSTVEPAPSTADGAPPVGQ